MMFSHESIQELQKILEAVCTATASRAQIARLEELVEQSEEVQRFYIMYMDLHACLLSDNLASADQLPSVIENLRDEMRANASWPVSQTSETRTPEDLSTLSKSIVLEMPRNGFLRQISQFSLLPILLLSLLVGGLGIGIGSMLHQSTKQPLVTKGSPSAKTPVAVLAKHGALPMTHRVWVATVQRSDHCQWGGKGEDLPPGTRLAEGQRIELQSGTAELLFGKGALIMLEGPATLEMKSSQLAFLSSGNLRAKVPPSAIGFTVETPAAHIVDFGTEFAVSLESSGAAEIRVFDGKVEIAPPASRSADWKQAARIELTAGHAMRAAPPMRKQDGTFASRIVGPSGIAFDLEGHCYVASGRTNEILRYDGETGQPMDTFAQEGLDFPTGLAFGPKGHLYVGSFQSDEILRFDGTTGALIDTFVPRGRGGLNAPFALAFGPDDKHLYVSSYGSDEVLCFDGKTGKPIRPLVRAGTSELDGPQGLAFGPNGQLYVASGNTSRVLGFDARTGKLQRVIKLAREGQEVNPTGLAFDSQGQLYVASALAHQVLRIDLGSSPSSIEKFASIGMAHPLGLCFDARGRLHVSNSTTSNVVRCMNAPQQPVTVLIQNWKPISFADSGMVSQHFFSLVGEDDEMPCL